MESKREFIKGKHYYLDDKRVVFTALFHLERGFCCGNICRHCPYDPKYESGAEKISEEFVFIKNQS